MENLLIRRTIASAFLVVAAGASAVSAAEPADLAETYAQAQQALPGKKTEPAPQPAVSKAFSPRNAPYGFFGGSAEGCAPSGATPVVFIHGNANSAADWKTELETYRKAGYDDCRLYGVTWLSPAQQKDPYNNLHTAPQGAIVADFIEDVKRYSGSPSVDVVAHSMGVTQALEGIDARGLWPVVRRFVSIGGALRGLEFCRVTPTKVCGGGDQETFGFGPPSALVSNPRMAEGGLRDLPRKAPSTSFYSISAGAVDEILCAGAPGSVLAGCMKTATFDPAPGVEAQLEAVTPTGTEMAHWHHFEIRDLTGPVQLNMLRTQCRAEECCEGYAGCRSAAP